MTKAREIEEGSDADDEASSGSPTNTNNNSDDVSDPDGTSSDEEPVGDQSISSLFPSLKLNNKRDLKRSSTSSGSLPNVHTPTERTPRLTAGGSGSTSSDESTTPDSVSLPEQALIRIQSTGIAFLNRHRLLKALVYRLMPRSSERALDFFNATLPTFLYLGLLPEQMPVILTTILLFILFPLNKRIWQGLDWLLTRKNPFSILSKSKQEEFRRMRLQSLPQLSSFALLFVLGLILGLMLEYFPPTATLFRFIGSNRFLLLLCSLLGYGLDLILTMYMQRAFNAFVIRNQDQISTDRPATNRPAVSLHLLQRVLYFAKRLLSAIAGAEGLRFFSGYWGPELLIAEACTSKWVLQALEAEKKQYAFVSLAKTSHSYLDIDEEANQTIVVARPRSQYSLRLRMLNAFAELVPALASISSIEVIKFLYSSAFEEESELNILFLYFMFLTTYFLTYSAGQGYACWRSHCLESNERFSPIEIPLEKFTPDSDGSSVAADPRSDEEARTEDIILESDEDEEEKNFGRCKSEGEAKAKDKNRPGSGHLSN